MKNYAKSVNLALALVCAVLTLTMMVEPMLSQSWESSLMLVPEHLSAVGLHWPPYFTTINELMNYQGSLKLHQELTVEWDSLSGQGEIMRRADVEGRTLSSTFVLLEQKRKQPLAAGKTTTLLGPDDLVIVAATSSGEVRAIRIQSDPRMFHSESILPGQPKDRHDFVRLKIQILVRLPDDAQIQTVVFLKPVPNNKAGWGLTKLGTLQLEAKQLPNPK